MRRREVIALIGGAAAWPILSRAQEPARSALPRIGVLFPSTARASNSVLLLQSLAERGYVDSKTARFEVRYAYGRLERLPQLARELVDLPVDVIVAFAASATVAAREATASIPIVMVHAGDPTGAGLVQSLRHPGGNVTGTTSYLPEIVAKGIEVLRDPVPSIRRLAVLLVPSNRGSPLAAPEAQAAGASIGLDVLIIGVERAEELGAAFRKIEEANADSVFVFAEPLLFENRTRLLEFAARTRLPTMFQSGNVVRECGLIGYGPLLSAHYPRVADYVDKILKGSKPSDLPVEQSTRFELVINLRTAKALNLTIPPTLLARADEVIE